MIKTDISSIKELSDNFTHIQGENYTVPKDTLLTKTLVNTEVKLKTNENETRIKQDLNKT